MLHGLGLATATTLELSEAVVELLDVSKRAHLRIVRMAEYVRPVPGERRYWMRAHRR
jgi:hypothetical protein